MNTPLIYGWDGPVKVFQFLDNSIVEYKKCEEIGKNKYKVILEEEQFNWKCRYWWTSNKLRRWFILPDLQRRICYVDNIVSLPVPKEVVLTITIEEYWAQRINEHEIKYIGSKK
jgi:hypothetical protein